MVVEAIIDLFGPFLIPVVIFVLGAIGYYAYTEWDRPRWDKRIISAVSVGLLTLWSGEGYVASLVGCT